MVRPPKVEGYEDDVRVEFDLLETSAKVVRTAATYTAPNMSLVFVGLLAVGAFFHESHFLPTGIGMGLWLLLQLLGSALDEDFRSDLFWGVIGTLGHLVLYIVIGHVWSYVKLYVDISQRHLSEPLMAQVSACNDGECVLKFVWSIKLLIAQWTLTWPMSVLYTLTRDPLTIFTNLLFKWSQARYTWIIQSALGRSSTSDEWALLWFLGGAVAYFLAGYVWTHIKLFIEVWQGTLPKKLDTQVRAVYDNQASYWNFILDIKWLVMRWMLTWPFSFMYPLPPPRAHAHRIRLQAQSAQVRLGRQKGHGTEKQ